MPRIAPIARTEMRERQAKIADMARDGTVHPQQLECERRRPPDHRSALPGRERVSGPPRRSTALASAASPRRQCPARAGPGPWRPRRRRPRWSRPGCARRTMGCGSHRAARWWCATASRTRACWSWRSVSPLPREARRYVVRPERRWHRVARRYPVSLRSRRRRCSLLPSWVCRTVAQALRRTATPGRPRPQRPGPARRVRR